VPASRYNRRIFKGLWLTRRKALLVIVPLGCLLALGVGAGLLLYHLTQSYPHPRSMPAVTTKSAKDLLAEYGTFLQTNAPQVYTALQPGLTDSEIDSIESKYQIKLSPDLRALYRWHNGIASTGKLLLAFPDHSFIPLEDALAERASTRKQASGVEALLVGHRSSWVGVILDAAGDGYFFDPDRTEAEGSFFFNFAEDGSYVFFPALRN
jgi:cell wall assembly regulator SMI1